MMENLSLELLNSKPDILKENSIQGLYAPENAIQSFWSLKAKIELAIFQDHKTGETKQ